MQELLMTHGSVRSERDGWMDDNTRGLSLAAAAEWDEAAEAFAAAADVLARRAPDSTSHDALGLILANLAQACFRAGRTREALAHAQRACSIRVALTGEDAMPVSRARMDLAVMLGSLGRLDEAQSLMQRAISSMERHVGDEDVRLVVMLENAARLALAAGSPANAEPILLRLHALLDVHGLATDRADRLLGIVASVRARSRALPTAVYAHASVDEVGSDSSMHDDSMHDDSMHDVSMQETADEWDDQPLRDAVAITDVLLRTTPSGVIAITEPVNHDAEILAAFEHVVDTPAEPMIELVDEMPAASVDIMLDLADDFEPITIEPVTIEPVTVEVIEDDLLGLELGAELDDALADSMLTAPEPLEVAVPAPVVAATPEPLSALNAPLRPVVRHSEPMVHHGFGPPPAPIVHPAETGTDRATDLTVRRATPTQAPVVLPGAADAERSRTSRSMEEPESRPRRAPLSDRSTAGGSADTNGKSGSKGGLIIGGVSALAAAGAAAWYFLLR